MSEAQAKAADLMRARAELQQMVKLMACVMWKLRNAIGPELAVTVSAEDINTFVGSFTMQKPGVRMTDDGKHGVVLQLVDNQTGQRLMLPMNQGVVDGPEMDADRWNTFCQICVQDGPDDGWGVDIAAVMEEVDRVRAARDAAPVKLGLVK